MSPKESQANSETTDKFDNLLFLDEDIEFNDSDLELNFDDYLAKRSQ